MAGAMLLIAGVLAVALRVPTAQKSARPAREAKDDVKRATNTSLLRRLWWKLRPPHDLMRVDGLVIDRTGKRSHALWPGPTGAGKSESVATVRCDGARPWLAVMPDLSDPLRRRADFVWTAGESQTPIDFLKGTPEDVAERLTTVFRSGGNGVWMMAAREAATQVIRNLDRASTPRTLQAIGAGVEDLTESNRRLRTACEGWVTRFVATAMAMGPSVAAGGVDIADLLRAGKGVVIDNDRWKHPALCGDTVAFGLAEAKRVGDLVPGGFRLIFEEADQLEERIDLADPFFAAGRRRRIAVDALLHAEEDADDAMATNSATRVYFRPNKPEQRAKVAKALDLSEGKVDSIPDYHAWIEHDGKVRRLVRFPKPPKTENPPESARGPQVGEFTDTENGHGGDGHRWELIELPRWDVPEDDDDEPDEQLALPPPSTTLQKLLKSIYPEGGCERWAGKHDRAGHRAGKGCPADCAIAEHVDGCYGLVWVDGRWQKVHRLRWELAYGVIPIDENGRKLTVDHQRTCPKDCSKLAHLSIITRGENSQRRWRVAGH